MKIQSLAVVFAIIILPIVLILSYYIHAEVDTIALQTSLDTKLIDSTHDAMSAFEINTANEDLSSVADSLRTIIEASTNVFFNTLATNLGISNASKLAITSYVPAVLYTLYDGYYIYSPTRVPNVVNYNDNAVYVGDRGVTFEGTINYKNEANAIITIGTYKFDKDEYAKEKDDDITNNESETAKSARQTSLFNSLKTSGIPYEFGQMLYFNEDGTCSTVTHVDKDGLSADTKYKQEHVLKSYMPYSARYVDSNYDFTINYTLDNYLTIMGTLNGVYYSKTGYLISKETVKSVNVEGVIGGDEILKYNEVNAEEILLNGQHKITMEIEPRLEDNTISEPITITYDPAAIIADGSNNYVEAKERLERLYDDQDANNALIQEYECELANLSAIQYYVKAQIFSDWVYNNLNMIKASNISEEIATLNESSYSTESNLDLFHKFDEDDFIIFDDSINPELEDSPFFTHKLEVIKNNIQYNLNLAISSYNEMLQVRNVQMPVIKNNEWEYILTRVSVVSFMQGLTCGVKTYNNYAIASSTNNEITVIPTEIYYTKKEEYNTSDITHEYHKIDCDDLEEIDKYICFKSKEIKYDKIYDKPSKRYIYDHRNLGCYRCAITSNYEKDVAKDGAGTLIRGYSDDIKISLLPEKKKRAYYVGVAKERQNLYKTNALTDSNGFEIFHNGIAAASDEHRPLLGRAESVASGTSKRPISDIRSLELTFANTGEFERGKFDKKLTNYATVTLQLKLNNADLIDYDILLNLNQKTPQMVTVPIHLNKDIPLSSIQLVKVNVADEDVRGDLLNVRIIYE